MPTVTLNQEGQAIHGHFLVLNTSQSVLMLARYGWLMKTFGFQ
jgi:hypothetical protein